MYKIINDCVANACDNIPEIIEKFFQSATESSVACIRVWLD